MTRIARSALALILAVAVGGLVGCDDKKVTVPTKTDNELPKPMTGGGGGGGPKKTEGGGPQQKAD